MTDAGASVSNQSPVPVRSLSGQVRNRGPWVTVEYDPFELVNIGHTSALGANAGVSFQDPDTCNLFQVFLPAESYHYAEQVHETTVERTGSYSSCFLKCDGLLSNQRHQALFVRTADCLPVFVNVLDTDWYGIVHAGWRGLTSGIVPAVLDRFNDNRVELVVGPHICQDCYEVGNNVIENVTESLGVPPEVLLNEDVISENSELSLLTVLRKQLGEYENRIETLWSVSRCTSCDDGVPLLSYRDSGTENRLLNWIRHSP
ncbi:MAG: polyphenol oxidase family protein [bacterium]